MRWWSLLGTAVTFVLSTFVFINYLAMLDFHRDVNAAKGELVRSSADTSLADRAKKADNDRFDGKPLDSDDQLARYPWIAKFNIEYFVGVDGISMAMILLTTVLFFLSMIASWGIEKHVKGYCMLFLILETGVLGSFFALDFFLFYIFWEVMLLPMYFLIGIWGGPRREYAAIKFFLYTLFGSVFILIALLGFYFTDVQDFVHKDIVHTKQNEVIARYPDMKIPAVMDDKGKPLQPKKGEDPAVVAKRKQLELEKKAQVHSFDLLILARAGIAAMQWNSSTASRHAPNTSSRSSSNEKATASPRARKQSRNALKARRSSRKTSSS